MENAKLLFYFKALRSCESTYYIYANIIKKEKLCKT